MVLHPIFPLEVAALYLHGEVCRHSLGISQRACTKLPQLLNPRVIPKEMPLFSAKVASLGLGLNVHLLHLFQLLGLCLSLLLLFLQLLFLSYHGNRSGLRALLYIP